MPATDTYAASTAAMSLHARLAEIDLAAVPVVCTDRHIPRKEQAALARKLFKSLGLRGISVTAPRYSMASSVDVSMPKREDYTRDDHGQIDFATDPAAQANGEARHKVSAILDTAFPNHVDRSDGQSDHFDYRWSIQ